MAKHRIGAAVIAIIVSAVIPCSVHAQLLVSEIMFDLESGADTGREWIELFNSGSAAIDVTTWKLFEAETNHKITEFQGGASLASGGYAVLADNPAKFLADNPTYTGMLLDSVFGLSNSGETLVVRDADLVDRDQVSYTSDSGGAGDGKTLARVGSDGTSFVARAPTPGSGDLLVVGGGSVGTEDHAEPDTATASSTTVLDNAPTATGSTFPVEPQLYAYAGKDRFVLVGADVLFEGKALSKEGELLEGSGVRYSWNFGDGSVSDNQVASHHFAHPGTYVVVLDVSSGKYVGTHRITVVAEPPQLSLIRLDDGAIQIHNASARDIDLSFWHVRVGDAFFTIPKNTILLKRGSSWLRQDATKLPTGEPVLVYPNGREAVHVETLAQEPVPSRVAPVVYAEDVETPLSVTQTAVRADGEVRVPEEANAEPRVQEEVDATSTHPTTSSQVASVGHVFGTMPHWGWLVALVGMLGVVSAGVLMSFPSEALHGLAAQPTEDVRTHAETGTDVAHWDIIDADEEAR